MTDEIKVAPSSDQATGTDDALVGDKDQASELEKLPLHLHPRGKELVAEKNAAKREVEAYRRLGASPEVIAEKFSRLQLLEELVSAEEADKPAAPKPGTQEFSAEAEDRWARQQLERLYPELKEIKSLKERAAVADEMVASIKAATEDEAWETTEEIATEMDMDARSLADLTIPIIKGDRKLLRLYHTGKADQAVRGAVKILRTKVGGVSETKTSDDIAARAARITKTTETATKAPKTHAPGRPETTVRKEDTPSTWAEAGARAQARLDKMGT